MDQTDSHVTTVVTGPESLTALAWAVDQAQAEDRFARVVIITDHHDVARSVRHWLGSKGLINVTVQTGKRLADELARPTSPVLPRLLESQAVRLVAETEADKLGLDPAGRHRFYRSLTTAFHEMAERADTPDDDSVDDPDDMNLLVERLYTEYRKGVGERGYHLPSELPHMAADALLDHWIPGHEPAVIYYLPRRLSIGDTQMARVLLERGKCQVVAGLVGDDNADGPVHKLLGVLGNQGVREVSIAPKAIDPLCQRANESALTIVAVPDPEEEVRMVVRSIAGNEAPFHRIAVIHRQDNPYSSLLRQELDFARIPYSGVTHRSLGDTQTGLLLLGLVDLAVGLNGHQGTIDRERFIEWIASTPVRWTREQVETASSPLSRTVPATSWANLARNARANGTVQNWKSRLDVYLAQMESQTEMAYGRDDDDPFMRRLRRSVTELQEFLVRLAGALDNFGNSAGMEWESASMQLKSLMTTYRWAVVEESPDDVRRIEELVDSLVSLKEWGTAFSPEALRESIREGLQSQASDRGEPVGAGVYIGPPSGIAGTEYDVMYALGMVERQFPPRPRANSWLAQNRTELDRVAALERYDFMAAVAAAREVVLSWPATTAERRSAYPSRWLIEAANHLHQREGGNNRLTHENLTENASAKPWLTVVPSREAGLQNLHGSHMQPSDGTEYNLMHLVTETRATLLHHPAIASDLRMANALNARNARNGNVLSPWDGLLGPDITRVAAIGTKDYPISPSALETWGTCPYKFFLSRILGIAAPPEEEEDEMSAADRGSLVHKILERFVKEGNQTDETDLLELAETEFAIAQERGITGYPLLWEMAKEDIRAGLQNFLAAEAEWLPDSTGESSAEESFGKGSEIGEVRVATDDLGEIWFRGKIDRIDRVGEDIRVRDFKTGRPEPYFDGTRGRRADRTLANGRAMQLPVYVAAARTKYPDPAVHISGSYCFPLADKNTHDVAPYTEDDWGEFQVPLTAIVGAARRGVFPATPETAGDSDQERSNCTYCDFKRLCPTRRRQVWERKARGDAATVLPFNSLGSKAAIGADDNDE